MKKQQVDEEAQWQILFHLYFSSQIEIDLKSINQEFLLLKKHSNSRFHNRIKNYELKSALFVNLGFNIYNI